MSENDLFAKMIGIYEDLRLWIGFGHHDDDSVLEGHRKPEFGQLLFYKLTVSLDNYVVRRLHVWWLNEIVTIIKFIECGSKFSKKGRMTTAKFTFDVRVKKVQLLYWRYGQAFLFHFLILDWLNYLEEIMSSIS